MALSLEDWYLNMWPHQLLERGLRYPTHDYEGMVAKLERPAQMGL